MKICRCFHFINNRADEYVNKGVRQQYKGELGLKPSTLSQSLEPEYVTFNEDEDLAYIALQVIVDTLPSVMLKCITLVIFAI